MPLQVARTNHNLRSQPRRQSAADHQLALKSRWQPIALGQAGRQMVMVLAVPATDLVAIVVRIAVAVVVFLVASTVTAAMIVIVPIFFFIFIMTVSMVLSDGHRR